MVNDCSYLVFQDEYNNHDLITKLFWEKELSYELVYILYFIKVTVLDFLPLEGYSFDDDTCSSN